MITLKVVFAAAKASRSPRNVHHYQVQSASGAYRTRASDRCDCGHAPPADTLVQTRRPGGCSVHEARMLIRCRWPVRRVDACILLTAYGRFLFSRGQLGPDRSLHEVAGRGPLSSSLRRRIRRRRVRFDSRVSCGQAAFRIPKLRLGQSGIPRRQPPRVILPQA